MVKNIKTTIIFLILIGTIGIAINMIFGTGNVTYLSRFQVEGVTYYKYDFHAYFENVTDNIQAVTELNLQLPTRTWINNLSWSSLANNLAIILDYIIFGLNILMYPFRIGGYIIINTWTILGIKPQVDSASPIYWLYHLAEWMISLQIPYI